MVDRFDTPSVGGLVVTFRDITDRRIAQEDLRRRAMYDQLTGLASRDTLRSVASELLGEATSACPVSMLYCDLDRLKVVNDSLGHHVGDEVIAAVAERWNALLPPRATLSRFGGDEFVICYPHERGRLDALEFAEALLRDLRTPLRIADNELTVSASIGVTTITAGGTTIDEALRDADAALYEAKGAGRNQIKEFDPAMRRSVLERLHLEQELRRALREGDVVVHLQPIVDLATGLPESFEALVRWHTEERGWVPAQTIISLAEETGLIVPLGEQVLDLACDAIARIRRLTGAPIRVAVNTSAMQLLRPDFGDTVRATLQRHGLPSDALVLEVTESILLDEEGLARGTLRDLHVQGVCISLDDFGTGYSSLSYLGTFPLDQLKLDRALVTGTAETATGAAVLAGIIRITQNLGLPVVAEGLENLADVKRLRGLGATLGQGWHYARAMEPQEALDWALARVTQGPRTEPSVRWSSERPS